MIQPSRPRNAANVNNDGGILWDKGWLYFGDISCVWDHNLISKPFAVTFFRQKDVASFCNHSFEQSYERVQRWLRSVRHPTPIKHDRRVVFVDVPNYRASWFCIKHWKYGFEIVHDNCIKLPLSRTDLPKCLVPRTESLPPGRPVDNYPFMRAGRFETVNTV